MDNSTYNEKRYRRKKQWYRVKLGIAQFINKPLINVIWILLIMGVVFFVIGKNKIINHIDMESYIPKILVPELNGFMMFGLIILLLIIIFAILQGVGELTARKDEADVFRAFCDRRDVKNEAPILIFKKKMKNKEVTAREFYTTIPMQKWQERKENIADIMNIHFIGEIEYGGKSNGNRIILITVKGRKPPERGVLFDEYF